MKLTELFFHSPVLLSHREFFDQAKLTDVIINKNLRKTEISLSCEEVIPKKVILEVAKDLREVYQLRVVKIATVYPTSLFSVDYFEQILYYIEKKYPHLYYFVKDSALELIEDTLVFKLKGNGVDILLYNELDTAISDLIFEEFTLRFHVKFKAGGKNKNEEDPQEKANKEQEFLKKTLEESIRRQELDKPPVEKKEAPQNNYKYPKVSFKKTPITQLTAETGKVEVTGTIFKVDRRDFNNSQKGKVHFYITDYEGSVMCQFLTKKQELDALMEEFKKGDQVTICGETVYDKYIREFVVDAKVKDIEKSTVPPRQDECENKRVELHLHTNMSAIDGVNPIEDYIALAASLGHRAIAVTDHGVVQAFPDAYKTAKKAGVKLIYGVEGYLVNDLTNIVTGEANCSLLDEFVVFDIETTGLSPAENKITEIGACKIKNGEIIERFSTFVNPQIPIPENIVKLTGITDEMVKDAPLIETVMQDFLAFCGHCPLVAHNADFDVSFIKRKCKEQNIEYMPPYLDTLALSRAMLPELSRHKLNLVCSHLGIKLEGHHRAVNDAEATAAVFLEFVKRLSKKGVTKLHEINTSLKGSDANFYKHLAHHIIILVKNPVGLKNLYQLVSRSHIDYFYKTPRIPKSELMAHREGLIIGSACEAGELYRAALKGESYENLLNIARFYDYLEIQPLGNNQYLIDNGTVNGKEQLMELNRQIIQVGEKLNKPVVATGDVHFMDPRGALYRAILMSGKKFKDADNQPPLYYRTTKEMLQEFSYLPEETAKEVVIHAPNAIVDMVEDGFEPIPSTKHPPVIDGAEDEIKEMTYERAYEIYGNPLPDLVQSRIEKELNSIINNGFSVMYLIAQKLVAKSLSDGYLVGSRGSVGSSFAAFLMGITEVNSLCAHYVCPACKYSEFIEDGSYSSGCDMPDKNCPKCGEELKKDGHDIPFETFLGFEGDKEPDIDLNFSGDYQPVAHKYIEELFGEGHVFRAGTIGTIAEKTAYGYVKNYFEERGKILNAAEEARLIVSCTGAKATTGQHPGGIMIVPRENEVYEFTPIQHPANEKESGVITTHFDYHKLHDTLLKLDILGHDDPTVLKMLKDLTGLDPILIPLDDEKTMSLFTSTEALGVKEEDIGSKTGTFGVPEFGTRFVRQMLEDTRPQTFEELVRISGLSHGTDVWLNNAQEIVRSGTAPLKEAICTRDDIMIYLIHKGLPPKRAFTIMEQVRKGKGLRDQDVEEMKEHNVPQWYIDSCIKIKYMFPKAHAVAYVTMGFRVAYYKVHYPLAYYCAYFSVRADDFDSSIMTKGREKVQQLIQEYNQALNNLTAKEKNILTILEICNEMYARGFDFLPVDLYRSHPMDFLMEEGKLRPPLTSLKGLGLSVAENIRKAREEQEFFTREDFAMRTRASSAIMELLAEYGCLNGLPESSQISLF